LNTYSKYALLILLLISVAGNGNAQDKRSLEQQKKENIEKIKLTQTLLEQTRRNKSSSLTQLDILNRGISYRESLLENLSDEQKRIDTEISLLEEEIENNTKDIEAMKAQYADMIRLAYRYLEKDYSMMYILSSEDINQAYQRIRYIKYTNDYRRSSIERINAQNDSLILRKSRLTEKKLEKTEVIRQTKIEQSTLLKDKNQKSLTLKELQKREKELLAEIKRREELQNRIESEIRKILEEEARKAKAANKPHVLTPEEKLVSDDFAKNAGRLPWPSERGIITTKFGKQNHPDLKGVVITSNGIDITTPEGTEARTVFRGEVTRVIAFAGANYTVIVKHGNYRSVYVNLVNVKVKAGDRVGTRENIGTIYTDSDNLTRLHFQIWKDMTLLDPEIWLAR
jgi:septal ring factor EnvC (AmiA/AmiB activator)